MWTYFININATNTLTSVLTQGLYSAIMTLCMVCIIDYFYNLLPKKKIYFILPSVFTVFITSGIIIVLHYFIHTYDIFNTVFPTVIVAFLFSLYTTKKIKEGRAKCLMKNQEDL